MFDQQVLHDYWEQWRLAGGNRQERLAAEGGGDRSHYQVSDAVEAGDATVIELLVALAETAPSDADAGLIGAGPLEELLSVHASRLATVEGAALLDAIDAGARTSRRFRLALRSAFMGDEVPTAVKERLRRFLEPPRS